MLILLVAIIFSPTVLLLCKRFFHFYVSLYKIFINTQELMYISHSDLAWWINQCLFKAVVIGYISFSLGPRSHNLDLRESHTAFYTHFFESNPLAHLLLSSFLFSLSIQKRREKTVCISSLKFLWFFITWVINIYLS